MTRREEKDWSKWSCARTELVKLMKQVDSGFVQISLEPGPLFGDVGGGGGGGRCDVKEMSMMGRQPFYLWTEDGGFQILEA